MENPHRKSEGAGKNSEVAASYIVAPYAARNLDLDSKKPLTSEEFSDLGDVPSVLGGSLCPHGAECRRQWIYITGTETADCAHCYQNLNRAELARILAGL